MAVILAVLLAGIQAVAYFVTHQKPGWINLVLTFLPPVIFYFLIKSFVAEFVYSRIKPIYKHIHQLKVTRDEKFVPNFDHDVIEQVESDVKEWEESRQKEIMALKNMAEYRKEFLGNVSHELKTPIFSIQGYLHTLIDGGLEDDKINRDYLLKAARNADRLNKIVEDLSLVSEFEAGVLQLEVTRFDVSLLIKEVFESVEIQAAAKDIKLKIKDGQDRPWFVLADRERISRVLENLVTNSIKYGKHDGLTRVGIYDMDENILVEVTDNGVGIEQDQIPRVFERFYRTDKGRSRAEGGTGLGLSIVKHIVEAHGQTITVRSNPEIGSTFGFTLRKNS